jgi:hypothetical protein
MNITDMKVGMRVRCVYGAKFKGKTGTIRSVLVFVHTPRRDGNISIIWDDGTIDESGWSLASSFEPHQDQSLQPKPISSHICICGIFRGDCIYHKD